MLQGWSVCHESEKKKTYWCRQIYFCSIIPGKRKPMTCGRYAIWVVLDCEVYAAMPHFPLELKTITSSEKT